MMLCLRQLNLRVQELEVELEMPTRHRHEGVGDVSLIVRDSKPRCAALLGHILSRMLETGRL